MSDQERLELLYSRTNSNGSLNGPVYFFDCEDDVEARRKNTRTALELIDEHASQQSPESLNELRAMLHEFSRTRCDNVDPSCETARTANSRDVIFSDQAQSDLARIWLSSDREQQQRFAKDVRGLQKRLLCATDGVEPTTESGSFPAIAQFGIVRARYRLANDRPATRIVAHLAVLRR
jgi:hypothetical protein